MKSKLGWKKSRNLSVNQVHSQLKSNCPHVRPLQGRGEVEVEVQQLVHAAAFLNLRALHVAEQLQEPLKRFLEQNKDWALVVVKWSTYSPPSIPTIRVQIPLKPTVFSVKFVLAKNEMKEKRGRDWPIFWKNKDFTLNYVKANLYWPRYNGHCDKLLSEIPVNSKLFD